MASGLLSNFQSPAALARFFLTTVAGVGLDLWTKHLAVEQLGDGSRVAFLPGWLHFEYTQNYGAVFGLGQGQRWLFVAVSIGAILFLSYLFAASKRRQWFYQLVLGILLAGVLGNMYDRIVYGYVRDMIHALPRWPHLFPWIFNVADSLLCVGVGLMVLYSFLHRDAAEKPPASN